MFYFIARLLGPKMRSFVFWLLTPLGIWWFMIHSGVLKETIAQNTEVWIVDNGGGEVLLKVKTNLAILQLEREMKDLSRLEVEAERAVHATAQELDELTTHHAALQEQMLLLADGLEGQLVFDHTLGRTLTQAELQAQAEATLVEFGHIEAQQKKYAEAYELQQRTVERTQKMQQEAAQSVDSLNALLTLISAQAMWQKTLGNEEYTIDRLQAELEYAQQLANEREALTRELSPQEVLVANLPNLPQEQRSPHADLVGELRADGRGQSR